MIRLRRGTIDDAAAMAKIFNYYVATSTVIFSNHQLSADEMADRLRSIIDRYPFIVAESDEHVTGYCFCHAWHPDPVYSRTWEITIYIDHQSTSQGIGSQLLNEIIREARLRNAHTLISCITAGNIACEKLHTNAGFRLNGLFPQVGFKFGTYLDDAIYQLIL